MIAIRCKDNTRAFRRDGTLFPGDKWTFVEEATPAQRDEPMLLVLEVEDEFDPRLEEYKPEPLPVPEPDPAPVVEQAAREQAQADLTALQAEHETLRSQFQTLQAQLTQSEDARTCLEVQVTQQAEQLEAFAQVNQEMGQEREGLLQEIADLKAVLEAANDKALNAPAVETSATAQNVPASPAESPAPENGGKEVKPGKAQAN